MLVHSKDKFFLFSQGSLRGIILEFGFLHIPNYVLGFSTNKGNSLCVFIPWGINGNWLISVVWKFTTCWFFGRALLGTKYGRVFASPVTHTWLIGSEVLPCLSQPVMIERDEREIASPHFHFSAYYYRPLILACYPRPLTAKCIRVSYFLVTILIGYSRSEWWNLSDGYFFSCLNSLVLKFVLNI